MSPSIDQISIAIILLLGAALSVTLFLKYKAAGTKRRMQHMLRRAGLDPDIDFSGDNEQLIKDIRSVCKKCQAEDVCERWLAGDLEGGNEFCPNAEIIANLTRSQS